MKCRNDDPSQLRRWNKLAVAAAAVAAVVAAVFVSLSGSFWQNCDS